MAKDEKRVQITLELSTTMLKYLRAEMSLNNTFKKAADGEKLTASRVVGMVAYGEGSGAFEHEIKAMIPHEWYDDIKVIHENRKVLMPDGSVIVTATSKN